MHTPVWELRPHPVEIPSCGLWGSPPPLPTSLESLTSPTPHLILWPPARPAVWGSLMGTCSYDLEPLQTLFPTWNTLVLFFSWLIPARASNPTQEAPPLGSLPSHPLSVWGPLTYAFFLGTSLNFLFLICKMSLKIILTLENCFELNELTEKLFNIPLGVY